MIKYKCDIMQKLKNAGFSTYRIRNEKLIGQREQTNIRAGVIVSTAVINKICALLNCQPGDLLEYVPDDDLKTAGTETADN
ncbi:MAG: helix-turn-helix domain-containing protein [Oscillospiraceae bacterium]